MSMTPIWRWVCALLRLPPSLPATFPCRHSMPTHMRASSRHWHCQIQCACKMPMLTISLMDVSRHCQKWMLLAMAKFLGGEALLTKQTVRPSSQWVYLWPACRWRWTALRMALFWKAPREGSYFPHHHCQHNVHIIVILLVIRIFFSSFNKVDLLRSMLADCCVPRSQEWDTMVAVGGWRPPWLACVYFAKL